ANFTPEATVLTASALVLFSLSITAWGLQQIYARGFYARKQMWTPVLIGTTATLVAIPLMVWLSQPDMMGVTGLALASSLAILGYAFALALVWHRRNGFKGVEGMTLTLGRSVGAGIISGVVGWKVADLILEATGPTFGSSLLAFAAGGTVIAGIYLGLSWLLGSPELRQLSGRVS
ncbi:MAG: lipid II flippase MurJ, partial [Acidimicrobiia bacterium]